MLAAGAMPCFPVKHTRTIAPVCLELPPAGIMVTIVSGLAILLRPDSSLRTLFEPEPVPSEEALALTATLCRPDGWELRLSIGDHSGRELSADLTDMVASRGDPSVDLSLRLAFDADPRFDAYPQGTARLLRPSRFFGGSSFRGSELGMWSVDVAEQSEGLVPRSLEVKLQCDGLEASGTTLVPKGPIFLECDLKLDERASRVAALTSGRALGNEIVRFERGRVILQEAIGLGMVAGVVGSFDARPATPSASE